ncbi:MAG: oligosaccharide flippase family protein [Cyanothece sp. SIO2G6]|nr:oligosaccharide flippase family protein [Cyanothece sp. SIO2G6]
MTPSLKKLAVRGATWTLISYGATQFLRFGSNVILAYLLVPEMFGLMALVNVVLIGLRLFSDVGIGPSIVQNERGEEPDFLNTAWTIQVYRGVGVWLVGCLIAWPVAQFYGESQLAVLLPVAALTALIAGFNSTSLFTADRRMDQSRLAVIELCGQTVSIIVMIGIASVHRSVWALVFGGLCGSTTRMLVSHLWHSDVRNRFTWNKSDALALVKFGRWIYVSTLLGFILNYGDQLIMGKFLTTRDLGIYSIAVLMTKVIQQLLNRMAQKVLFPLYSKLNHLSPIQLRPKVKKVRFALMGVFLPPLWLLVILGPELIQTVYNSEYQEAGWMLQVLAAGLIIYVSSVIGPFYLSYGNSFLFMKLQAVRSVLLLVCMAIGGSIAGSSGVIVGVAATRLAFYPIQTFVYNKYSLWMPKLDALGILSSIVIIASGLWLKALFLPPDIGLQIKEFIKALIS